MSGPKTVIVGGVAGGASAATRARRLNEHAEIVMFEKGEHVSFANCGLPYHIGGQIESRDKLLLTSPELFQTRFRIDARVRHEVVRIDRAGKCVEVVNHATGERFREPYDKLILTPGARPVVPPWQGVRASNVFTLRDVTDMDRIKAWVDGHSSGRAVVVGAGFIGLEMVECLVERGMQVAVVELLEQIMPPLDIEMAREMEESIRARGVELYLDTSVEDLLPEGDHVRGVRLNDGRELPADLVLISIGVRPNTELAEEAGLKIGESKAIAVNGFLQTNDPDIYAVGDAAEVVHGVTGQSMRIPLAGPANRNGRLAGGHAVGMESGEAHSVLGTAIVGVFGKAAALTGLSSKAARRAGIACEAVYAIRGHHAGYYPGAEQMVLKLIFDPQTRRVLGAQAVGGAGVDKRIDVVATVIHFGGTIDDVAGLDLAYAPQFGSAKDPLHIAAFVAQNQASRLMKQALPDEVPVAGQLVDVRDPEEFDAGTLSGAVNIPLNALRDRLNEIDSSGPVVVFCQVGQRGYNAARILMQHGFKDVINLAGGYRMHRRAWAVEAGAVSEVRS